jgi:DNA topoisomerase I
MKEVAEELGNTPAVARSSYVDPRVIEGYENERTIAAGVRRANRAKKPGERQTILEDSTARLIRKVAGVSQAGVDTRLASWWACS